MEARKTTLASNSLQFGLLTGIMLVGFSLLLFASGLGKNWNLHFIGCAFITIGISYGTVTLRNNVFEGFISFNTAFKSCFFILLYAAVISALFTFVYVQFIDKTFIEKILVEEEQHMILNGLEPEQIEARMTACKRLITPVMIMLLSFLRTLFPGSIIGLIVAFIVKRDNPNPATGYIKLNR